MADFSPAAIEYQRRRWERADAYRFAAPGTPEAKMPGYRHPWAEVARQEQMAADEARARAAAEQDEFEREVLSLRHELAKIRLDYELRRFHQKYSPDQPRVPAGSREGGQWTDGGGSGAGRGDPRILSDATPDNDAIPGARYAQSRIRGPIIVRIGDRTFQVSGGQAVRLEEAQGRAESAIARVRELDPNWRPAPSLYESIEGRIRSYHAEAREAQARASELASVGIGPGPFAGESIPARGPERDFTTAERLEINRIGSETGCHTCGTSGPGTQSNNFVVDHQPPTALNSSGRSQRLYPQCLSCSLLQGGWASYLTRSK